MYLVFSDPLETEGGTEGYHTVYLYCGAQSLYNIWPGMCIYWPPDQNRELMLSSVPVFGELSTHRCLVCLHLGAVRFTSVVFHPDIVRGVALQIEKVFFEVSTCGEVFIISKMSFRTADNNYSTLLMR